MENNLVSQMPVPIPVRVWTVPPRLLVVDDDRSYGLILQKEARKMGVELEICNSIAEAVAVNCQGKMDAMVVDYRLGSSLGTQLIKMLDTRVPVILISASEPPSTLNREGIRTFLHKRVGPRVILKEALQAARENAVTDKHSRAIDFFEKPSWDLAWKTVLTAALALALLSLFSISQRQASPSNPFPLKWDRIPINTDGRFA